MSHHTRSLLLYSNIANVAPLLGKTACARVYNKHMHYLGMRHKYERRTQRKAQTTTPYIRFLDKVTFIVGVIGPFTVVPQIYSIFSTHSTAGVSLADADVVVSGGRGVGSSEGFSVIEELAALLGGAVGCSRAVTSAGWRPHSDQVGQTGTKISPEIYIACGISGATQHMAGCKGAKRLLAINPDGEASIFASADYAVIGDLHEVVPAISAEIRKVRGT